MKKNILITLLLASSLVLVGCTTQPTPVQESDEAGTNSQRPQEPATTSQIEAEDANKYQDYQASAVQKSVSEGSKTILFFHAAWCPTCRAAEKEILADLDAIPDHVRIFKVDYDSETELKNKYNIVTQHTFVVVDQDLNTITKWNGGSLEEILENI